MAQVDEVRAEYEALAGGSDGVVPAELERIGWMIEELRVSLFAQQLGTPYPVSAKRIYQVLDQLG
jgi:ATP-dependent helicase HrpA